MTDFSKILSPEAFQHYESLLKLAIELDKQIAPSMLIYVNKDGFMEKRPSPSEYIKLWVKEYSDRKEFYTDEEEKAWLKKEREREIKHLQETSEASFKVYYRKFLKLIAAELRIQPQGGNQQVLKEEIEELIKEDHLKQAMEKMDEFYENKTKYEEDAIELILQQARLTEIEKMYNQQVIEEKEYFLQKAQIRKAILKLMMGM